MARTRDRGQRDAAQSASKSVRWRLGIYIRLSKEDNVKSDEDSNSVKNQKKLLTEYYRNHESEFESAELYIDDGYTGTDSNRDAFKRMLKAVQDKRINCVAVKDLSRLSRNYSEAGSYIDTYFTMWDVRFICLGEPAIDSYKNPESATNIAVPITNVMNDNFCLQTSKKVRQVFDYKRRQGEFIGAFAPYGYAKHPEQRNKLVIDEEAACVVRDIFAWYVRGMSKNAIAVKLNALGLPNPAAYKKSKGLRYCHPHSDIAGTLWSASSVSRILENRMYTGTMVQGKYKIKSYKVHTQIRTEESEWFVVEDTHEPIVCKELFEAAQSLRQRDTRAAPSQREVYLFAGFLRCHDCRKAMHRRKTGQYIYYICRTYKEQSKTACTKHSIRHDILERTVLDAIRRQIEITVSVRRLAAGVQDAPASKNAPVPFDRTIADKERELKKVSGYRKRLYQDMCDGLITRTEYSEMRDGYRVSAKQIQAELDALREERRTAQQRAKEDDPDWTAFLRDGNIASLSRELLVALVDGLSIKEDGGIVIRFKFADPFKRAEESGSGQIETV